MTEPLVLDLVLSCSAIHAFDVWTTRTSMWWPRDHTITGDIDLQIVIEPRVGGRIFERGADGSEHAWGSVTEWNPPRRLAYTWHLGQDPTTPTDVAITFEPVGDDACRLVIRHDGWERLGARADAGQRANRAGWDAVLAPFAAAAQRDE